MTRCLTVKTDCREKTVRVPDGENLLEAIRRTGAVLDAPCGGNGTCGKCLVKWNGRTVRACRTAVSEDGTVSFTETKAGAIVTEAAAGRVSEGKPSGGSALGEASPQDPELVLAVDLGTTTVAAELIDRKSGERIGLASAWNAQSPYGADVLSRCRFCMDRPDGTAVLRDAIRDQIRGMVLRLGADPARIRETMIAGNTVMQHLYAGISPVSIARAPFRPEVTFTGDEPAEQGVSYAPCVAGYVGGDITAGLLASGLPEKKGRSLFLDIGTNGEMALGGADGFVACAVASGPAFEGAGIVCGTAAVNGAVSRVRLENGVPVYETIGGEPAKGICGSGLIDLLAVLIDSGVVTGSGRLLGPDEAPEAFRSRMGEDGNGNGIFYLTGDRSVFLTAGDVRNLQLAKAAVRAGIEVLLRETGLRAEELDHLCLAGGFGTVLNVRSAAAIGMIPPCLAEKTVPLGNSSLAGARAALLDRNAREELMKLPSRIRYLELSGNGDFNEVFPEQMTFYEEDDEWN